MGLYRYRTSAFAGGLALISVAMSGPSYGAVAIYTLDVDYDNGFAGGSPVYAGALVATVADVGAPGSGKISLTLDVEGLADTSYNVNTWWLQVAPTYAGTLTFGTPSKTGTFTTPAISQRSTPTSAAGKDGANFEDFDLWFNTFNNSFVNGDTITYQITSSAAGLNALDFLQLDSTSSGSFTPAGDFYTAAEVFQGASGGSNTFYLGADTFVDPPNPVSEPASLALLGGGLITLAAFTRRRRTKA